MTVRQCEFCQQSPHHPECPVLMHTLIPEEREMNDVYRCRGTCSCAHWKSHWKKSPKGLLNEFMDHLRDFPVNRLPM